MLCSESNRQRISIIEPARKTPAFRHGDIRAVPFWGVMGWVLFDSLQRVCYTVKYEPEESL